MRSDRRIKEDMLCLSTYLRIYLQEITLLQYTMVLEGKMPGKMQDRLRFVRFRNGSRIYLISAILEVKGTPN